MSDMLERARSLFHPISQADPGNQAMFSIIAAFGLLIRRETLDECGKICEVNSSSSALTKIRGLIEKEKDV